LGAEVCGEDRVSKGKEGSHDFYTGDGVHVHAKLCKKLYTSKEEEEGEQKEVNIPLVFVADVSRKAVRLP
jgi:hypothetical protein